MEVSIEIDGIYCPQCKSLHPTLYWHEKFDDYLDEKKYIKKLADAYKKMGVIVSNKQIQTHFSQHLEMVGIKRALNTNKCIVCNSTTQFKNIKTNNFVCSNECKYMDNEAY